MFTFLKDLPIALQRMDRGDIGIEKTGQYTTGEVQRRDDDDWNKNVGIGDEEKQMHLRNGGKNEKKLSIFNLLKNLLTDWM